MKDLEKTKKVNPTQTSCIWLFKLDLVYLKVYLIQSYLYMKWRESIPQLKDFLIFFQGKCSILWKYMYMKV